jgi:precorrin-2/cobalt-factor-2 C20-methyltransferase
MKNEERKMKNEKLPLATFYGVGLGPGDPELITLKAVRVLTEVECIFFPAGKTSGHSIARQIVAPLGLSEEKFRPVALCMGRDRRDDLRTYDDAADRIVEELRRGRSAAWIAEGDPMLYGTFLHVHAAMRQRHPEVRIEIVPGVSSPHAAAARAGMPLAYLDEMVAFVPAAYALDRVPALLAEFTSVVLFKVNTLFDQFLEMLATFPGDIEAVYLENVGRSEERMITDLGALRGQELPYFSLVLLRKSAAGDLAPDGTLRTRSRARHEVKE